MNTDEWVEDEELAAVLVLLAPRTAGQKHAVHDSVIGRSGVGCNAAEQYANETFALRDECWCDGGLHGHDDDGIPNCPPNFEHFSSGIRGSWYKHLGRSLVFNRAPVDDEALTVLLDCLRSLNEPLLAGPS